MRMAELFKDVDAIIASATPVSATPIGAETVTIAGETMPVRRTWKRPGRMPIGVQIIAAPWREDICLRIAAALDAAGIVKTPIAAL